jgi:orotate phosphoribosyltransferase
MPISDLPIRTGHFALESGLHADTWIDLDALFVDVRVCAPAIDALAAQLAAFEISAICGPLLGGAFLAQALAQRLNRHFFCAERVAVSPGAGLFSTRYRVPAGQRKQLAGAHLAVVDDVISAGSSVRATIADARDAGAVVVVVGALMVLGAVGVRHFVDASLPLVAPERRALAMWPPESCPLCAAGVALERPA